MKNFFLGSLAFLVLAQTTLAQDDPEKTLAKAGRALGSYNVDPSNNADKLMEAVNLIKEAEAAEINQSKLKTWQTKGEIYNALADKDLTSMMLDAEGYQLQYVDAPIIAGSSFIKALELALKKYEKKAALDGLGEAASKMNNLGNYFIQKQDYTNAARMLDFVITVDNVLRQNEGQPAIQDTSLANHKYVVAFCSSASGNTTRAKELFKELFDASSDEPNVYASYSNLLMKDGDEAGALAVLEKGRSRFPASSDILFATINYYISKQQFEMLETLLKEAIAAEPNNPSVYSALGNVYMNLFSQEFTKNGDSDTAKKYFNEALNYFSQASSIDPNQFDAVYSIGSLYFNKAVELIKKAGSLGLSKADQEKYNMLIKQSSELMVTALPYFQKTESLEPNDANTLIALSEIYARMDDLEKSKLFKERLQVVRDGGRHESSYFKF